MSLLISCLLLLISYLSINKNISDGARTGGIGVSGFIIFLCVVL